MYCYRLHICAYKPVNNCVFICIPTKAFWFAMPSTNKTPIVRGLATNNNNMQSVLIVNMETI